MRNRVLKSMSLVSIALAVAFLAPQRASADEDDPPSRVARLAYTHGNVSFNPAGTDDWVTAVVNRPITIGDKLWSDNGARAELHIDSAVIRLSDSTGFSFLNLNDQTTQIRITEGTLYIRVRRLGNDETFEVDTPNLAFSILRPGRYRISVNEAGDSTVVLVRDGEGEVTGGGSAYTIHSREEGIFNGTDQLEADVQGIREDEDDFDQWCADRDRREDHSASARYVSDDVVGYEDLDEYGGWRPVPEYGTVWFPHTTVVGWAPYRYGHWVWIAPWGWTWVDDEPWGFAPFHYGRWVVVGGVWGWVPCPPRPVVVGAVYVRPVYAPALVAWVGGAHWGVGVSVGGAAAGVAWFPLGPRDVYCPSYHVSQTYVQNVNVSNTTIINKTQVTNVYNNVYVNKTVNVTNVTYQNQTAPNAVTAVSHQAFTSAQPVHSNMIRVGAREFTSAPVAPMAPAVAPQQRSVLGTGVEARVRPPAAVVNRPVVAKQAPPPPPVSFAKQQQVVQANGGRPPAISELRQERPEGPQAVHNNVRIAPAVRPEMQQNTQQNTQANRPVTPRGNPNRAASANNANQPGQSNRPENVRENNANQPGQVNRPGNLPANAGNQQNQINRPGNAPPNAGNPKTYNDRPPSSRPSSFDNVNPQLDQKHQQQMQDLRMKQDQERQRIEQQQVQQREKLAQKYPDIQRQPQVEQKQQQVVQKQQQVEQRPPQQVDQRPQQVEQRPQQVEQKPQQVEQKPPQVDRKQQQFEQKQQQIEQKQQQQLQQLEQKHSQQQQQLEQRQQQERQRQERPAKQDNPAKQEKRNDKPHH